MTIASAPSTVPQAPLWSAQRAHHWYGAQPRVLGANFIPASAINQLEMWQAETFDPERIDLELGWAAALGMNTMRVFLHDLLWAHDAAGFKQRIDTYLKIASGHGIGTMLVLFDSCWDPRPALGSQRSPTPGIHNSGWVQSPGAAQLADPACYPALRAYVEDIVSSFGNDERVWCWDLWNEPDNQGGGMGYYQPFEAKDKIALVADLLPQVFGWAQACAPRQPLTSGVWLGQDWLAGSPQLNAVQRVQLALSDVVTFHDYSWPEVFLLRIQQLRSYGRPLVCTEYMARGMGSTFDTSLLIARAEQVGMINWGFVCGKSQTNMPWDSWKNPYISAPPSVWFHDLLHTDGTPYRAHEIALLRQHVDAA
ncbi:MAG: 1,4-beta-xylanase [Pseudomonadota bacterium]